MSNLFPQLEAVRIQVTPDVRRRHLEAVSDAVAATRPKRTRFRLLAVAVAVLFVLPVLALAANDAEPGDLLYPIRQVLPWNDERLPHDEPVDDLPGVDRGKTDVLRSGVGDLVGGDSVRPTDDVERDPPSADDPAREEPAADERQPPPTSDTGDDRGSPGETPPDDEPPSDRRGGRP